MCPSQTDPKVRYRGILGFLSTVRSPIRTCIACRRKEEQRALLRIARSPEGDLGLWVGSGRSAYIHPAPDCIENAFQKGRLERALRGRIAGEEREALRKVLECKLR